MEAKASKTDRDSIIIIVITKMVLHQQLINKRKAT